MKELDHYRKALAGKKAEEIIGWALDTFPEGKVLLATSFGAEDQVLTEMASRAKKSIRLFTLDTGRLFEETYNTMQRTLVRYGLRCEIYAPDTQELECMVGENGPNLFYESVEKRKACCKVRKMNPLKRALKEGAAWICGLRRDQSVTREEIGVIEWDETHGLYKINPLFDWTEQDVWDYIHNNDIPYNVLHDCGFPSIGCAPCTRAVKAGEDIRAGRWWWENPERRECGLHPKKGE